MSKKANSLFLLFLATIFYQPIWASELAPRITTVVGIQSDGETLTITGQDFGDKPQAAPIFFDTADYVLVNGQFSQPYENLSDGEIVPTGLNWPWYGGNVKDFMRVSRTGTGRGSRSVHFKGVIGVNDFGEAHDTWLEGPSGFPDPITRAVKKLYLTWYFRPDFDPYDHPGSHKFIRVWDTRSGAPVGIRISWTQMHLTYDQEGSGQKPSWKRWGGEINKWNKMELYIDTEAGVIKAWTNGVLIHDVKDFVPGGFNTTGEFLGIQPRLWGLDGSGDAEFLGKTIELSDFYADSTLARVEICSESIWSKCTAREPQPALSWAPTEITVRLNVGELGNLADAYVYVIKESGIHNHIGFPLADVIRPSSPALD